MAVECPDGVRVRRPWGVWALGLVPAALAAVVYAKSLGNPFVYDDHLTIVTNASIRDLTSLRAIVEGSRFRPLENVSFAVDFALWGVNPVGFHLTNVALHVINVALLFALAWAVVRDQRAGRVDDWHWPDVPATTALVTATVFAVHPLLTEAVAYVSGRGDLLAAMFFLLALVCARNAVVRRQRAWTALALVCFALGVASKEVAIMFPVVFLAYDRLLLRDVPGAGQRLRRLHLPLLGIIALLAAARTASFLWIERPTEGSPLFRMGVYLLVQLEVLWRYVLLLVAPLSLSVFHDVGLSPRRSLLGAVALIAVGALAFRGRRRAPIAAFGVAWFVALLVPSSSIVPLHNTMAEHRVYVASAGALLMFASGVRWLLAAVAPQPAWLRAAPFAGLIVILAALSTLTVARNGVWADNVELWRDAVAKAPRWQTRLALGDALREQRRCADAIPVYREAIAHTPARLVAYHRLHACLEEDGRISEARQVAETLRTLDPDFTGLCRELRAFSQGRLPLEQCVAELANGVARPERPRRGP